MTIREKVSEDLKVAMKSQDKDRVGVLRMVLSELKYHEKGGQVGTTISDEEALKVISSYHKKLDKALGEFPEGDQREKLRYEIKVVEEYLPKKLSEEEIERKVEEILKNASEKQFGLLMGEVMKKLGAAADGKVVSRILKQKLSG